MGLDSVELVLEVEDRFHISIPDQDAEKLTTVGELTDYVQKLTANMHGTICLTSRSFHRVRKELTEKFGHSRSSIRLDTRLDELVPRENRRSHWRKIQARLDGAPRLVLTGPMFWGTVFAVLSTCLAVVAYTQSAWSLVAALVSSMILARYLSLPFAVNFPSYSATVRDLSLAVCKFPKAPVENLARPDIELQVRSIILQQLGVPLDEIKRDTNFIKYLNF